MRDEWNYLPVHQLTAWFFTRCDSTWLFFIHFLSTIVWIYFILFEFLALYSIWISFFLFRKRVHRSYVDRYTYPEKKLSNTAMKFFVAQIFVHSTIFLNFRQNTFRSVHAQNFQKIWKIKENLTSIREVIKLLF